MRLLVIMVIPYVLDEDLKIPDDNYEIIEDTGNWNFSWKKLNDIFEEPKMMDIL